VGSGAVLAEGVRIGRHSIVDQHALVRHDARVGSLCFLGKGAVVGDFAVVGDGASMDLGCRLGDVAFPGPGARLLDRSRLPGSGPGKPAVVGEGALCLFTMVGL
jgi:carbonic anhydrase/acetyltransferase-like protein (isoleucine patch superfamily)